MWPQDVPYPPKQLKFYGLRIARKPNGQRIRTKVNGKKSKKMVWGEIEILNDLNSRMI
jgi:hypothetical protein